MDFSSAAPIFVLTAGSILFLVHVVKIARDFLTPGWCIWACGTRAKIVQLLWSRFRRRAVADELDKEVACQLLDRQLNQFRMALKVLLFVSVMPPMVVASSRVVLGNQRATFAQDILQVLWYAVLLLADWCPRLITSRNLNCWYSGLMAIPALHIIPLFCPSDQLLAKVSITRVLGAVLSLGRMNLSAAVLWSAVHMACEYWSHVAEGQGMDDFLWLFWPLMLCMLIGKFEVQLEAELRAGIEAKVMQDRQSASDALSAMFYDVVVELDHNRCINTPAPHLAAFLLRSTLTPLERTPLEDLLVDEEDRVRLRNLLCPAGGPGASAFVELAHARMQGAMGTVFGVELFGYRFRGPGRHQRYLVGIRDSGDLHSGGVPMAPDGPQPAAMEPPDEVAAVIDPDDDNFRMLSHTRGFSKRIMPVAEGTCFLPAVVKAAKFKAWVQQAVNWHFADFSEDEEKPSEPLPESFVVTLRPHGRNNPMRTSAVCRLRVDDRDLSEDEPQGGMFAVELKFSDIRQGSRGARRTSGNGDGGSSSSSSSSRRGTPSFSLPMSLEDQSAI